MVQATPTAKMKKTDKNSAILMSPYRTKHCVYVSIYITTVVYIIFILNDDKKVFFYTDKNIIESFPIG